MTAVPLLRASVVAGGLILVPATGCDTADATAFDPPPQSFRSGDSSGPGQEDAGDSESGFGPWADSGIDPEAAAIGHDGRAGRYVTEMKDAGDDPRNAGCQSVHLGDDTCEKAVIMYLPDRCKDDTHLWEAIPDHECTPYREQTNYKLHSCADVCKAANLPGGRCVRSPEDLCWPSLSAHCECAELY